MKTAFRSRYGQPDILSIRDVEKPIPKDNEVLIKVHATTVSRTDCHVLWGTPLIMKFFMGFSKPKLTVTGTDFAGEIEATGKDVKSLKPGDKVMGFEFFGLKSHAQYLTLPESGEMVPMPANLTYGQSAACIEGAFYALNVIRQMKPKAGQKALVYGATGAIGSASVQFFKYYGVYVTAVCRGEHGDLLKSLGADRIIDYTAEDFTKDNERYDFVLDAVGKSSFGKCKGLLTKDGLYASSGGPELLRVLLGSIFGGKRFIFAPPKDVKGCLLFTKDLAEQGKFRPLIDRTYPLEKIAEAFTYVAMGEKLGTVILKMDE